MTPTFAEISIDNLRFDPDNPRFPLSLDGTNQEAVLRFMITDAGLLDLIGSIAAQDFFPGEPLLVSPDDPGRENWRVIEGNRRLAACLLLNNPARAPQRSQAITELARRGHKPTNIPCLQFNRREAILEHLGYRHVTGIKEWEPLAKARFLEQSYRKAKGAKRTRLQTVARAIGSRSDYVGRLLTALAIYERIELRHFYGISKLTERTLSFSLLSSALAYLAIVEWLGLETSQDIDIGPLNEDNLELLVRWMFEREDAPPEARRDKDGKRTRLGESRNLGTLASVVANPTARDALISGQTLETAARISQGAEAFREYLQIAVQNTQFAYEEFGEHLEVSDDDLAKATRLHRRAGQLKRAIHERLGEDE